ncbi:MAG: response regulator [Flavobacterium sp. BFFFF2]|nr:MAG: response regulator [Flavobacterium sp. BFFFF2]
MINTVLSIDDDQVTQTLNGFHLNADKFCNTIIEAYNGLEAIAFFKKLDSGEISMERFPEVIFLDINMPVMDGWDFFETFKSEFAHFEAKTTIFILSSSINPEDLARAKNEKCIAGFLAKPLNAENIKRVKSILGFKEPL